MTQACVKCGIDKPLDQFERRADRPRPRRTCRQCRYESRDRDRERARHRDYMRQRRKDAPDVVRQNWERSVYGVAKEDMEAKACQICGGTERLSIDHDHGTGKVRGLLCGRCNSGIGMFRDNPELLAKAVSYLRGTP